MPLQLVHRGGVTRRGPTSHAPDRLRPVPSWTETWVIHLEGASIQVCFWVAFERYCDIRQYPNQHDAQVVVNIAESLNLPGVAAEMEQEVDTAALVARLRPQPKCRPLPLSCSSGVSKPAADVPLAAEAPPAASGGSSSSGVPASVQVRSQTKLPRKIFAMFGGSVWCNVVVVVVVVVVDVVVVAVVVVVVVWWFGGSVVCVVFAMILYHRRSGTHAAGASCSRSRWPRTNHAAGAARRQM